MSKNFSLSLTHTLSLSFFLSLAHTHTRTPVGIRLMMNTKYCRIHRKTAHRNSMTYHTLLSCEKPNGRSVYNVSIIFMQVLLRSKEFDD